MRSSEIDMTFKECPSLDALNFMENGQSFFSVLNKRNSEIIFQELFSRNIISIISIDEPAPNCSEFYGSETSCVGIETESKEASNTLIEKHENCIIFRLQKLYTYMCSNNRKFHNSFHFTVA